jgi:hypothetical protein
LLQLCPSAILQALEHRRDCLASERLAGDQRTRNALEGVAGFLVDAPEPVTGSTRVGSVVADARMREASSIAIDIERPFCRVPA